MEIWSSSLYKEKAAYSGPTSPSTATPRSLPFKAKDMLPTSRSRCTLTLSPLRNSSPYPPSLPLLCQIALLAKKAQPCLSQPT